MAAANGKAKGAWTGSPRCLAGMAAGGITGLLAGIGVVIAVAKEIDLGGWEWVPLALLGLVAVIGGLLADAAASGCLRAEEIGRR